MLTENMQKVLESIIAPIFTAWHCMYFVLNRPFAAGAYHLLDQAKGQPLTRDAAVDAARELQKSVLKRWEEILNQVPILLCHLGRHVSGVPNTYRPCFMRR